MTSSANASGPALMACLAEFHNAHPKLPLTANNCTGGLVTDSLISFLNLSSTARNTLSEMSSWSNFVAAYCLSPPPDDGCPFGVCPNPDIAGLFVRIATYITALYTSGLTVPDPVFGSYLCTLASAGYLIFYSNKKEDTEDAIKGHLALIGCQVLAGLIALLKGELTQLHVIILALLCGSPMTWQLIIYSIGYSESVAEYFNRWGLQTFLPCDRRASFNGGDAQGQRQHSSEETANTTDYHSSLSVSSIRRDMPFRSIGKHMKRLTQYSIPFITAVVATLWATVAAIGLGHPHAIKFSQPSCNIASITPSIITCITPVGLVVGGCVQTLIYKRFRNTSTSHPALTYAIQLMIAQAPVATVIYTCYVVWITAMEIYIKGIPDRHITFSFGQFLALLPVCLVMISYIRAIWSMMISVEDRVIALVLEEEDRSDELETMTSHPGYPGPRSTPNP